MLIIAGLVGIVMLAALGTGMWAVIIVKPLPNCLTLVIVLSVANSLFISYAIYDMARTVWNESMRWLDINRR